MLPVRITLPFLSIALFLLLGTAGIAQGILTVPTGTKLNVPSGGTLSLNGSLIINNGGTVNNAGNVTISRTGITNADFTDNNSTPQNYGAGKFIITGTGGTQTVLGGTFYDLEINDAAGVSMLSSQTVNHNLILTNGSFSIGTNILSLNGAVTGTGKVKGSQFAILVIGGAAGTLNFDQTDSLSRSLQDFIFSNGSATLGNPMQVYGNLNLTNSTFHINAQSLVLKSIGNGFTNTARVGNLTGSTVDGATNVNVERYIASPQRAWHLLSAIAVTGSQTIKQAWQENGGAIIAGQGTLITSNLYTAVNGFDMTSISSSILIHNQGGFAGPSYNYNLANTNATVLSSHPGYMLFVRGDRNFTAANSPSTSPTVLRATGTLTQGLQTAFISSSGTGRTLVGNPYASPIDMEPIFSGTTNLAQDMYVWDPSLTGLYGVGGFRLVQRIGPNTYQQTPVVLGGGAITDATAQYIHSGQAFFLRTIGTAGTTNATVAFTESVKASNVSVVNPITNGINDQQLIVNLLAVNPGNIESLADGIRIRYNDSYVADTTDDVEKMGNFAENISSLRQNKKLIVEDRPMINADDTIFLHTTNIAVKNYRFEIGTLNFIQTGVTAFLQDSYLNTSTPIDLSGAINDIDFSTSSDPLSLAQDRFRIVFKLVAPLPISFIDIKAYQTAGTNGQNAAVAVEWKIASELNMKHYEVERSTDGSSFSRSATQLATGNNGLDANYKWTDLNPVTGNNFYRVRAVANSGEIKYSSVVKVNIGKIVRDITVYPNPVTNKLINIRFSDINKGIYQLRLINNIGQVVLSRKLTHMGGSAITVVPLGNIAAGNYQVEIIAADGTRIVTPIVIATSQ